MKWAGRALYLQHCGSDKVNAATLFRGEQENLEASRFLPSTPSYIFYPKSWRGGYIMKYIFLNFYSKNNASFYCNLRYFFEHLNLIAYEVLDPAFLKS